MGAPGAITSSQRGLLDAWLEWLEAESLSVIRLERSAYAPQPWDQLTECLTRAHGVVLIGFQQLDARMAPWRPGTLEERLGAGWWTSPWLQVEAGMAVALGLPLLVVPDVGVGEGVFESDGGGGLVMSSPLSSPGPARWVTQVQKRWRVGAPT